MAIGLFPLLSLCLFARFSRRFFFLWPFQILMALFAEDLKFIKRHIKYKPANTDTKGNTNLWEGYAGGQGYYICEQRLLYILKE